MRAAALALILTACSACAALRPGPAPEPLAVKRWFFDAKSLQLVWTPESGETEHLRLDQADGFRCYSRADDEAVRDLIAELRAKACPY